MHTESQIQGNNNASHRDGTTLPLTEVGTLSDSPTEKKENEGRPNGCFHTAGHGTLANLSR